MSWRFALSSKSGPKSGPRSGTSRLALVIGILIGVATLVIAGASSASAASSVHYVALGDSYSSGVGAGDYISSSGDCDRSPNAYSQLWATAHSPASYVSVACSGATTTDVTSTQLSALSSATTLASITIGGNDVNFSGVMEDCILYSTSTCVSDVDTAEANARSELPGLLNTVYNNIRSAAPNARVVVLDYPHFYDLAESSGCVGLSTQDRTSIDGGIDILDGLIQTAVAAHSNFVFADVRNAFSGHEICDSTSWLHSTNFLDIDESYHPTADGHSGADLSRVGPDNSIAPAG
jgi:lysophospholipase L1-like esterase